MENKDTQFAFAPEDRDYSGEIVELVRSGAAGGSLADVLEKYHNNDIAMAFEELSEAERRTVANALGDSRLSDVLSYTDRAGEYLQGISPDTLADIIENMDAADAARVLDELDEDNKNEVLELIGDKEVKEEIELLFSYRENEFGSKMSTNYILIDRALNVKGAMRALVKEAADNDNIYTVFVEDGGRFFGAIDLKALIVARSETPLDELIATNFPYVYDTDTVSDNIEWLRSYSEPLIPVISKESGRLLGVITAEDIVEIVDEELGEDYAKLAALGAEEEEGEPFLLSIKKRAPWLIVLLFMGLTVSFVVGLFEGVVAELPAIVAFQSLILGMAGNVGTQSLAVTVRALGADGEFDRRKRLSVMFKETRVALLNGIVLGAVSFVVVLVYLFIIGGGGIAFALSCAGCVGVAMCFAMTVSGFVGAAIPLLLDRFGADPAVASGPLITTVNDLVAVISYYTLAWLLLLKFV